jgi:hypothetical protein
MDSNAVDYNDEHTISGTSDGTYDTYTDEEYPVENDQTAKADAGKPRLSLVPRQIIWDIAAAREYAVNGKYRNPNNWRRVSVERYRDALYRHFMKYLDDPTAVDSESGLPHLYHIATNVAFLCELEKNEVDNSKE